MNYIAGLLAAAAFIVMYGLVGAMDYDDAVQAENTYKQMVCDGLWPDYKNLNVECE